MTYNANSIKVLEGLEAVRKRPAMYIGSTGSRGLHHLIFEILDNSIDEHLAGECDKIIVTLNRDGSISIEDNGRGIPVELHEKGISTERLIFTTLHAGGKFDNNSYKVSGGLHGVGTSVVNALSEWLEVEIYRNGYMYKDRYERGVPVINLVNNELKPVKRINKRGTKVTFYPDATIFDKVEFDINVIKNRLKELSYLNPSLELIFEYYINNEYYKETFKEKEGICKFVNDIIKVNNLQPLHDDVIFIKGKAITEKSRSPIEVEIAMKYVLDYKETIISFCNNINTIEEGTHVTGFKTALTRTINSYAKELFKSKVKSNFAGSEVRSGLVAIISIKHPNPQFEGQTKTKLNNNDVKKAVDEVFTKEIQKYFDRNIKTIETIIENVIKAHKLNLAKEKSRKEIFNTSFKLATKSKLASCREKDPKKCELFLVEGDSAGGSAKQARNRKYQAILPLKGKNLNVEKGSIDKILKNEEFKTIISALGCGFGEGFGNDFDISKLKYHKIIIMTDADVDGSHIRTLLLTFFFRYMPELIYNGHIYIAMPPLYKITTNSKEIYLFSDKELLEYEKTLKGKYTLQRFKGLGEMNPEQLWETTMNPKTRRLGKVEIDDFVYADEITNILMGKKVEKRRNYIFKYGNLANIDI